MNAKKSSFYALSIAAVVFGVVLISSVLTLGQTPSKPPARVPEDRSSPLVVGNQNERQVQPPAGVAEAGSHPPVIGNPNERQAQPPAGVPDDLSPLVFGNPNERQAQQPVGVPEAASHPPVIDNQNEPQAPQPAGIPEDWSHHHLIFSNPGTAEDAWKNGTYDQWLTITNDPRYKMQQIKRSAGVNPLAAAPIADVKALAGSGTAAAYRLRMPVPIALDRWLGQTRGNQGTIKKDWSMNMGGAGASLTGTVGSLSGNISGSSTLVINSITLTASAPTPEQQTLTVNSLPTSTSNTVTVNNSSPSNSLVLTENGSAASGTGTFYAPPTSTATLVSITSGPNTLNVATSATASSSTGTFSSPPYSTTITIPNGIGSATTGFTSAGIATVTFSGPSAAGNTVTIGSTVYDFQTSTGSCAMSERCVHAGTTTTSATNLVNAIGGACYNSPQSDCSGNDPDVDAVIGATTSTVALVNITAGTISTFSKSGTNIAVSGSSIATPTTSNACSSGTAGTFVPSTSSATLASNLAAAINSSTCQTTYTIGATASYSSGTTLLVTNIPGASGAFSGGATGIFAWSGTATGTSGAASACTGTAPSFTVTFGTSATTSTLSQYLVAAINACSTSGANDAYVHATQNGSSLTINSTVLGTGSFGASSNTGVFNWTSTNTGGNGSSGCTSATAGTFGTGTTTGAVATSISSAINACTAYQATIGINNTSSVAGSAVTVYAYIPGTTGGSTISLPTPGGSFGATWGTSSLSGGSNGTPSATTFAYWSGSTYLTSAQVAANIVTTILANGTLSGTFNATSNGANVIISDKTVNAGNSDTATAGSFNAFTWSNNGDFSGGNAAVVGNMGAGVYPAKYTINPNATPSCTDYVAYNTGLAGVGTTVPSIIAYNNIYATTCSGSVPSVYWEYNTGGQIVTSPVPSYDGSQLAFVQTVGPASYLVILRYGATGATISAPTTEPAANYPGCSTPCMTSIEFNGPTLDTNSSPYYNYPSDTLYVGDNSGKLHEFIHVFNGTPAEELTGWPVTVSTQTAKTLTSPVYDSASGNIFVADSGGYLYSYPAAGGTLVQTSQLAATGSKGIVDAPLVDSSEAKVYVFVGQDGSTTTGNACVTTTGCDGVFQFSTTLTAGTGTCNSQNGTSWTTGTGFGSSCGSESVFGVGNASTILYDGTFDQIYYTNSGASGNLWTCAATSTPAPKLLNTVFTSGGFGATVSRANNVVNPLTSAAETCSPVTEIYNGTTDLIFLSVTGDGDPNPAGCPTGNACVYSYNVTTTPTTGCTSPCITPAAGLIAAPGTSGMVIDNVSSTAGASQIYFGLLGGTQACTGNGNGPGVGTGGCAIQAAQANLQ